MRRRLLFGGKGWEAPPPPGGVVTFKPNGFAYDVTYSNNGETKTITVPDAIIKTVTLDSYDSDIVITDIKFKKPTNQNVELKFNCMHYTVHRTETVRNFPYKGDTDIYGAGATVEVEANIAYTFGIISDNPEQTMAVVRTDEGFKSVSLTKNTPLVTTVETKAII